MSQILRFDTSDGKPIPVPNLQIAPAGDPSPKPAPRTPSVAAQIRRRHKKEAVLRRIAERLRPCVQAYRRLIDEKFPNEPDQFWQFVERGIDGCLGKGTPWQDRLGVVDGVLRGIKTLRDEVGCTKAEATSSMQSCLWDLRTEPLPKLTRGKARAAGRA